MTLDDWAKLDSLPEFVWMNADFSPLEAALTSHSIGPIPEKDTLLSLEEVQRQLRRSRASVYRYANTDPEILNPPYNPQKLNPEIRNNKDEPLQFHPKEVRRFASEVLGLNPTIEVQPPPETVTHELLRAILVELQSIHELLKSRS